MEIGERGQSGDRGQVRFRCESEASRGALYKLLVLGEREYFKAAWVGFRV
jgi:hypothetical protein